MALPPDRTSLPWVTLIAAASLVAGLPGLAGLETIEQPLPPTNLPPPPSLITISPGRRAFPITPERRAFLNLIRYIQGTWHNGLDSGYRVDSRSYDHFGDIGAYTIRRVAYLRQLDELGISYGDCYEQCQREIYSPEVQDQIILRLLYKNGQLAAIDKSIATPEDISRAMNSLRDYMSVRIYLWSDAYVFYRRNLLQLYQLAAAPSPAAKAECAPTSSLRCQLEALEGEGTPRARSQDQMKAPPLRWDKSLDELVRQGLVSPEERQRIRSGASATPQQSPPLQKAVPLIQWPSWPSVVARVGRASTEPINKPLSSREQALLQRIRAGGQVPQWRTYGKCNYNWAGWKLHTNGTRTTEADCGGAGMRWTVGVSCDRLLVARRTTDSGWSNWERPAGPDNKSRQGEDEMVAALCANAVTDP